MAPLEEFDAWLIDSLADQRLTRAERQTLADRLDALESPPDPQELRRRAFAVARASAFTEAEARGVIDWLEGVVKVIDRLASDPMERRGDLAEAHFSPGDACWTRIARLLDHARRCVDICVFTITDDRISRAIVDAHRRGVALRVITDDDKAWDEGSDIDRLLDAGIPVRVDRTEAHMHHKFALFDGDVLLGGSYNWTRGAAACNNENLIITNDPRLVGPFGRTFERLWDRLA